MKPKKAQGQGRVAADKTKALTLKTPQSVIHINHRISLLQYKYWVLLLKEYREQYERGELPDKNGFRYLPMSKVVEYIGYEPKKTDIWADLLALKNETIAYNYLEKDGKPAKYGAGFISEWLVTNGGIGFKLPTFLEEVMRGLNEPRSIFQIINWNIFNHFSGKYEAIIYKLCRDYIGVGRTPYMTLEAYREYMGLNSTDYAENKQLNKWVILGPCKRINESQVSDIFVTPEIDKKDRKAVGVHFKVEPKGQAALPFIEPEPDSAFRAVKAPIPPKLQEKYLALRSAEEIALCVERANEYGEQQEEAGKPPNYGALYRAAIEEGWHTAQAQKKAEAEAAQAQKKADAAAKRQAAAEAKTKARDGEAERPALLGRFEALPEAEREGLLAAFLETADPQARAAHKRKGFDSPFFLFPFAQFLKAHRPPA
jgi:hypothetical protein